jgi:hypothetical protein
MAAQASTSALDAMRLGLQAIVERSDAALARFVYIPGVPEAVQPLARLLLVLSLGSCCCLLSCCFFCWWRRRARTFAEPLLPKHAVRSDAFRPESVVRSADPDHIHEGRVCRASALAALASADVPPAVAAKPCSGGLAAYCATATVDARAAAPAPAALAEFKPLSPRNGAAPRPPQAAPKPQQEAKVVCVSDSIEAVEGGRGGGWGDLDGFPDTLTVSRHEYPTSRRGADRDTARKTSLGGPRGEREQPRGRAEPPTRAELPTPPRRATRDPRDARDARAAAPACATGAAAPRGSRGPPARR